MQGTSSFSLDLPTCHIFGHNAKNISYAYYFFDIETEMAKTMNDTTFPRYFAPENTILMLF